MLKRTLKLQLSEKSDCHSTHTESNDVCSNKSKSLGSSRADLKGHEKHNSFTFSRIERTSITADKFMSTCSYNPLHKLIVRCEPILRDTDNSVSPHIIQKLPQLYALPGYILKVHLMLSVCLYFTDTFKTENESFSESCVMFHWSIVL